MMGDDLYDRRDIEKLLLLDWGICVTEIENQKMKGEILVDEKGDFAGINEEVHFVDRGFMNTGLYMLRHDILDTPPVMIGGSSTEYGLPHTLAVIAKTTPVKLVKTNHWMQITTPEDLIRAEDFLA
jgi:NDP-sugar pyrophosphorylase family protein